MSKPITNPLRPVSGQASDLTRLAMVLTNTFFRAVATMARICISWHPFVCSENQFLLGIRTFFPPSSRTYRSAIAIVGPERGADPFILVEDLRPGLNPLVRGGEMGAARNPSSTKQGHK